MIRYKRLVRIVLGILILTGICSLISFFQIRNQIDETAESDAKLNFQDLFDDNVQLWSTVNKYDYDTDNKYGGDIKFEEEHLIPYTKKKAIKKTTKKVVKKLNEETNFARKVITLQRTYVKKFIYHAIHKTGSSLIRDELRRFCADFYLNCLSYDYCEPKPSIAQCSNNLVALSGGKQRNVDYGSFTAFRLLHGCCPALEESNEHEIGFDALVEHFPLYLEENRIFLADRFEAEMMFRFTILRHPVQQFISNYKMHQKNPYQQLSNLPPLEIAINEFYTAESNEKYELPGSLQILRSMLINCQAKELGWDGTRKGLISTIENLKEFDFVGTFESMDDSWKILRNLLKWPEKYFDSKKLNKFSLRKKHVLPRNLVEKIEEIQYADMELYEEAVILLDAELN